MDDRSPTATPAVPPVYCARCQRTRKPASVLCEECGETLHLQGYCPTCERFWKLDAGDLCPKHEVELLDQAPPSIELPPGERTSLVTIATFSHPNQAHAPRIRLEAEGIPTFLDGERIAGSTHYQVATGGVRLLVPASLASAARILIDQSWSAPIDPDENLDDAWDELAPDHGVRRRAIMKAAIIVILFGPIVIGLITCLRSLIVWLGF